MTRHPAIAEHLANQQEGGRIILPGQFTPGLSEAPAHLHPGPRNTPTSTAKKNPDPFLSQRVVSRPYALARKRA